MRTQLWLKFTEHDLLDFIRLCYIKAYAHPTTLHGEPVSVVCTGQSSLLDINYRTCVIC